MSKSTFQVPGISWILLGVCSIFAGMAFLLSTSQPLQLDLEFEVASTSTARQTGLSNRDSLGKKQAMLFVFDEDDRHGIWMKDMRFSIDILWLDSAQQIVTIEEDVSPDTYPEAYRPSKNARYVIELNAGASAEYSLKVGDQLSLPIL